MISKRNAHKVYDRNTPVISKGDPGWTSDNHQAGRRGDRYGTNPLSLIDQKIRQRESREVDLEDLGPIDHYEVGELVGTVMSNERDVAYFRVVEHITDEVTADGERIERARRQWKYAYVQKNGAL